jgi:hypothetical protein
VKEIQFVVSAVVQDLKENGELIPEPLSMRNYSGKLYVRIISDVKKQ